MSPVGDQHRVLAGGHRNCLFDRRREPLSPIPSELILFIDRLSRGSRRVHLHRRADGGHRRSRARSIGALCAWRVARLGPAPPPTATRHWLMVTEDDVDKAGRFFDVMAPRWCSSAGLLRGWKRGVDPGGSFGYGPAPLHCFHRGGLGGVERGPDRHRLCAGKQLAERSEPQLATSSIRCSAFMAGSVILFIVRRRRERS